MRLYNFQRGMNEWVFLVVPSRTLHYQIVSYERPEPVPRWRKVYRKIPKPLRHVIKLLAPADLGHMIVSAYLRQSPASETPK